MRHEVLVSVHGTLTRGYRPYCNHLFKYGGPIITINREMRMKNKAYWGKAGGRLLVDAWGRQLLHITNGIQ